MEGSELVAEASHCVRPARCCPGPAEPLQEEEEALDDDADGELQDETEMLCML